MSDEYVYRDDETFKYLCDQIMDKVCTPFIGSGISNDCKYVGKLGCFSNVEGHTVPGLKKHSV